MKKLNFLIVIYILNAYSFIFLIFPTVEISKNIFTEGIRKGTVVMDSMFFIVGLLLIISSLGYLLKKKWIITTMTKI